MHEGPDKIKRIHLEYPCGMRKSHPRGEYFGQGRGLSQAKIFIAEGEISSSHMN